MNPKNIKHIYMMHEKQFKLNNQSLPISKNIVPTSTKCLMQNSQKWSANYANWKTKSESLNKKTSNCLIKTKNTKKNY